MYYIDQIFSPKITHLFPEKYINEWMNLGKKFKFKKGELITTPKNVMEYVYIIAEGNAHVFHIHSDGKECVLNLLSSGDFIDVMNIFSEKESNLFSRALTEVTVVSVSTEEIRNIVERTPKLAVALLTHFSHRLHDTTQILEQVAYGKVEERLIFLLKKLADPSKEKNGWIPLPIFLTHKDLAGMIASTRETVTFLVNKLSNQNIIRQEDNMLWITLDNKD